MSLSSIRGLPESSDKCLNRHLRKQDTQRRRFYEDRGRDSSDASSSQGMPRVACSHQTLGEKHGMHLPSDLFERVNFADALILDFRPGRD